MKRLLFIIEYCAERKMLLICFQQFSVKSTTDGFPLLADEEYFISVCAVYANGRVSDPALQITTKGMWL